jgi:Ca-activated chloride channel family protein
LEKRKLRNTFCVIQNVSSMMKLDVKYFIVLFWIASAFTVKSQSGVRLSPSTFDFGNIAQWKNDTAIFNLENTGTSVFKFLPIAYNEQLRVILPKGNISPGNIVPVKVLYYTQDRGYFKQSIPIYISSANEPIQLVIKGKIIDFHPDAMLNCPTLSDDKPVKKYSEPFEIQVVDAISGKGLSGFDLIIKNTTEQQLIETSSKDRVYFDGLKDGKYAVTVNLSGYETGQQEVIVTRLTRKFIIKLMPDEELTVKTNPGNNTKEDEPIVIEPPAEDNSENLDIEKLREKFNERFKGKKIIEKDVILVKEKDKDSLTVDTGNVNIEEIPDFTSSGTLNTNKFVNNNIIFLVDVSGSMDKPEKLPYLKRSVSEMVKILRQEDLVSIVTYAGKTNVLVDGVTGNNKVELDQAVNGLVAKGQSYGTEALYLAYDRAKMNFIPGGNNQVILVSDGLFNSTDFSPKALYKLARQKARDEGIITSCIGFGKNEDALEFLKTLSTNGLGNFIQIKSEEDANTVLVREIMQNSKKQ